MKKRLKMMHAPWIAECKYTNGTDGKLLTAAMAMPVAFISVTTISPGCSGSGCGT